MGDSALVVILVLAVVDVHVLTKLCDQVSNEVDTPPLQLVVTLAFCAEGRRRIDPEPA